MIAQAKLEDRHIERLWRQIRAKDVSQTVVREAVVAEAVVEADAAVADGAKENRT